jgi:hypothetical protein
MAKQTPDRDSLGDSRRSLSRAAPAAGEAGDSGLRSGALRSDTSGRAAGGISSGWDCRLFTWASRWRPFTRATAGAGMTHPFLEADADHSFHVPARTGRKDGDVRAELLNALTGWTRDVLLKGPTGDGQLISERRV